ncbi:MAG: GNAT family N-acetyltransferase [Andreesenia angusta]|nr:GNAT family N-acetyltransferase [Andreesenia angusta]
MKFRLFNIDDMEEIEKVWNIYEESFPQYERRRIETQKRRHDSPYFKPMVIVDDENDKKVNGLFFYWDFEEFIFLEHFAINPKLRGNGIGSRILKKFCKKERMIILEIDPLDTDIAIRRKSFYEKLGFHYNDIEYSHPGYEKDYPEHELKIMTLGKRIDDKTFNNFLQLRDKYTID